MTGRVRPLVRLTRFGHGLAEWVWETGTARVSPFDSASDAADDARRDLARRETARRAVFWGDIAATPASGSTRAPLPAPAPPGGGCGCPRLSSCAYGAHSAGGGA